MRGRGGFAIICGMKDSKDSPKKEDSDPSGTYVEKCPYCGSGDIGPSSQIDSLEDRLIRFAECDRCGAQGPPADSTELALERWNVRIGWLPEPPKTPVSITESIKIGGDQT